MTMADGAWPSRPGALFALEGASRVSLSNAVVTIESPRRRPVAIFELRASGGPASQDKNFMGMGSGAEPVRIDVEDSFFRGSADFLTIGHTNPGRVDVRQSGLALEQSLISVPGGITPPADGAAMDISLSHITAMLGNPLLRVDLSGTARYLAPVRITASNNVIATDKDGQLIFMNSAAEGTDFSAALEWTGDNNVFEGFSELWSVKQPGMNSSTEYPASLSDWREEWAQSDESDSARPDQTISAHGEAVPLWNDQDLEFLEPIRFSPQWLRLNSAAVHAASVELLATDGLGLVGVDPDKLPEIITHAGESQAPSSAQMVTPELPIPDGS